MGESQFWGNAWAQFYPGFDRALNFQGCCSAERVPGDRRRSRGAHCVGRESAAHTAQEFFLGSSRTVHRDGRDARRSAPVQGAAPKQPTYASKGSKKELTTKEGHWSGAKKGGARGDSFLTNALSTLGVLALISTTPFIAIIVCVPLPDRAIGGPPRNQIESFASRLIVPV